MELGKSGGAGNALRPAVIPGSLSGRSDCRLAIGDDVRGLVQPWLRFFWPRDAQAGNLALAAALDQFGFVFRRAIDVVRCDRKVHPPHGTSYLESEWSDLEVLKAHVLRAFLVTFRVRSESGVG